MLHPIRYRAIHAKGGSISGLASTNDWSISILLQVAKGGVLHLNDTPWRINYLKLAFT